MIIFHIYKVKENHLKGIKTVVMSLMCFAGSVFANSTDLNFILGTAFSRLSNEQYMSPVTGLINSYASNESVKTRSFYGFGAEYNFDHITAKPITFGLGLSLYYMDSRNISGIETPGVNILPPPQDTLTYKLQTKSRTILLEPKLIYTASHLQPYILGGLGCAKNTLLNFSEGVVPGSLAVPSTSPYPNHTQTTFAYEVGLGSQYVLEGAKHNHAIIVHIEYRYLNLGQSRLGTASAQTTNQHITVNNTSNIVDFGITYRL
jgi:opacity protein-like surface antigen